MPIFEHVQKFAGKPVVDYDPDEGLRDPETCHYGIRLDEVYGEHERLTNRLAAFLHEPNVEKITGIVIGAWEEIGTMQIGSAPIVEALVAASSQLPNLRAIFLGDVICEESEISWIVQSDVAPLFLAYPKLEHFRVRGNEGLNLGYVDSAYLRSLVIETGGLSATIVRQVTAAALPNLEHLELWLGTGEYGGDVTMNEIQPILSGQLFPKLRYLGLRDSTFTDEIAIAIANAPILERIHVLDLSLGTLTNKGALALFESPVVQKLEKLDLHYHYLSTDMMDTFKQSSINVDLSDPQEGEEYDDDDEIYRYPAVTE